MKEAIRKDISFAMPFSMCLYRSMHYVFTMFVEVAINEVERTRIVGYAQSEKIRMDRAYAELIRLGIEQIILKGEEKRDFT